MLLTHKGERFIHDDRVLLVDKVADIPSFRGIYNRLAGVLCPYNPLSEEQRAEIINFAKTHIAQKGPSTISVRKHIPAALHPVMDELDNIFSRVAARAGTPVLRINSKAPSAPHSHETTLTWTFTGIGTIGVNKSDQHYAAPLDHIFIIHKSLKHMASQYSSADMPKITVMV